MVRRGSRRTSPRALGDTQVWRLLQKRTLNLSATHHDSREDEVGRSERYKDYKDYGAY